MTRPAVARCAIYTRKSTEEGLDQAFNSLDAQREACSAYIVSQRHEGWVALAEQYDDGGFSGGNMERPGLKRLMAEVAAGRVDVIVVYKIDRLTRSLSDFSKIVDVLDRAEASFVSITQSFNTTTSMGRLTLNVLLSFAQFEREVISERVRDKIAASKAKGMWMGGVVPLGYDARDRKLIINPEEAETVRHIMQRYLALGSVRDLVDELAVDGLLTKQQMQKKGTVRGGLPYRRGPLYHLLRNRIYIGEIAHHDKSYPGQHDAIVEPALFEAVQAKLATNATDRRMGVRAAQPSLLAGMIRDACDRPLSPTHAVKGSRRYRYYVSNEQVEVVGTATPPWRLPAADVEAAVLGGLQAALDDPGGLGVGHMATHDLARLQAELGKLATRLPTLCASDRRLFLHHIDLQIMIEDLQLIASFCVARLFEHLKLEPVDPRRHRFVACTLSKRGAQEQRVIVEPYGTRSAMPNADLIWFLGEAHLARRQLEMLPFDASAQGGERRRELTRVAKFSFLAPDIVTAIFDGRHPRDLTPRKMKRIGALPLSWAVQRQLLGFA